jgi:FkbM family methyltransferase
VLDIVDRHIRQRRLALDIGAHIGLFSRWLVDDFVWVNAFEPVKDYCEIFKRNMRNNFNYAIFNMALSDRYEVVGMKLYPEDTGCAHIARDAEGHIRAVPLDSLCLHVVDLIKIDVEGYELKVLKGAKETIARCKPIIVIENRGHGVKNFGEEDPIAALRYLDSLGAQTLATVGADVVLGFSHAEEFTAQEDALLDWP